MLKGFRNGLGVVLALSVVLRIGAWLVTPMIPMLVVLFVIVCLINLVVFGPGR